VADAVKVSSLGNGMFRVHDDDRSSIAYAAAAPGGTWVFLDGHVYVIDAATGRSERGKQHDETRALSAPMPATVAAINVKAGEQVSAGHVMIVLEAMKMELPITAPRDGRVKAILCRPGELVQPGVPLIELE
jgi:3-methylcrotonyl-CoA carboxylase alpha subunit